MKLMFIQELQVPFGEFEDLTAQAPDHGRGGQQVIALDAIVLSSETDADHGKPPLKDSRASLMRQACGLSPDGG
jgi:hypothetical protein